MRDKQPLAVIEAGSRSVRLLLCRVSANGTIQELPHNCRPYTWNLGDAIGPGGELTADGLTLAAAYLAKNVAEARRSAADPIIIIGTDVLRRARNREVLLKPYRDTCMIKVVQPVEEAQLSLIAVANAFRDELVPDQPVLIIDQGGGSTEVATGHRSGEQGVLLQECVSIPRGATSLRATFIASPSQPAAAFNEIVGACKVIVGEHLHLHFTNKPRAFGLGSVISNLMVGGRDIAPQKMHGRQLTLRALDQKVVTASRFLEKLNSQLVRAAEVPRLFAKMLPSEKGAKSPEESADNWLTIICGAPLLREIMAQLSISSITFCRNGLRYGAALGAAGVEPNAARILATSSL